MQNNKDIRLDNNNITQLGRLICKCSQQRNLKLGYVSKTKGSNPLAIIDLNVLNDEQMDFVLKTIPDLIEKEYPALSKDLFISEVLPNTKRHTYTLEGLGDFFDKDFVIEELVSHEYLKSFDQVIFCGRISRTPHFKVVTKQPLPAKIDLTPGSFFVRPTLPELRRCTNCQSLDHHQRDCTAGPICYFCAGRHPSKNCYEKRAQLRSFHASDSAIPAIQCAHCGGAHTSGSMKCEKIKTNMDAPLQKFNRQLLAFAERHPDYARTSRFFQGRMAKVASTAPATPPSENHTQNPKDVNSPPRDLNPQTQGLKSTPEDFPSIPNLTFIARNPAPPPAHTRLPNSPPLPTASPSYSSVVQTSPAPVEHVAPVTTSAIPLPAITQVGSVPSTSQHDSSSASAKLVQLKDLVLKMGNIVMRSTKNPAHREIIGYLLEMTNEFMGLLDG